MYNYVFGYFIEDISFFILFSVRKIKNPCIRRKSYKKSTTKTILDLSEKQIRIINSKPIFFSKIDTVPILIQECKDKLI